MKPPSASGSSSEYGRPHSRAQRQHHGREDQHHQVVEQVAEVDERHEVVAFHGQHPSFRPCVRHATIGQSLSRMGQARSPLKAGRANDFMEVPRPVVALARDLPPSHEIDWHSHPRFQLVYAARGVMTVDTQRRHLGRAAAARGLDAAAGGAPPHRARRGADAQPVHPPRRRGAHAADLRGIRGHAAAARADPARHRAAAGIRRARARRPRHAPAARRARLAAPPALQPADAEDRAARRDLRAPDGSAERRRDARRPGARHGTHARARWRATSAARPA